MLSMETCISYDGKTVETTTLPCASMGMKKGNWPMEPFHSISTFWHSSYTFWFAVLIAVLWGAVIVMSARSGASRHHDRHDTDQKV